VVPWRRRFGALLRLGQAIRPLTVGRLKKKIPLVKRAGTWPQPRHDRRMLVLGGCVQPSAAPDINAAAARLLDRVGVSLVQIDDGCCGAVAHHLCAEHQARDHMRHNIDVWWPHIERGIEAIVVTASGCGTQLRDYGLLLRDDPQYTAKAARVSELFRDLSQVVAEEGQRLIIVQADAAAAATDNRPRMTVAFQSPCSLQHGLKIRGLVESLLIRAGFTMVPVADGHLCCGSAGTYSILQPALSQQLKVNKLAALQAQDPDAIATANIGCLMHLAADADRPVRHWIELLEERLPVVDALN
jgi:glycolate oxidase iron-sulfur subunit